MRYGNFVLINNEKASGVLLIVKIVLLEYII